MIKAVLFDLDGTLLPMDQDVFVQHYFGGLAKKLSAYGYDPDALIKSVWRGTARMIKNDGSMTNEEAFWDEFSLLMGAHIRQHEPIFEEFYRKEFQAVQSVCGFDARAAEAVALVKECGCLAVLATNPLFPAIATQSRIRWAGLQPESFALYTTYENSRYCKPNLSYYRDILTQLALEPAQCLMIGNDVDEDMVAATLGMEVFLLTDCLINKSEAEISSYPRGSYPELLQWLAGKLK